jgi:hypothetical protein
MRKFKDSVFSKCNHESRNREEKIDLGKREDDERAVSDLFSGLALTVQVLGTH